MSNTRREPMLLFFRDYWRCLTCRFRGSYKRLNDWKCNCEDAR